MATRMKRKQMYLDEEADRALKRLAARMATTESEVMRRAIHEMSERTIEDREDFRETLRRAGLLAEFVDTGPIMSAEEAQAADEWLAEWAQRVGPIGVDAALNEDRDESDSRLL